MFSPQISTTETIFYSVAGLKTNFVKHYLHFSFPYQFVNRKCHDTQRMYRKSILVKGNFRGDIWRLGLNFFFFNMETLNKLPKYTN